MFTNHGPGAVVSLRPSQPRPFATPPTAASAARARARLRCPAHAGRDTAAAAAPTPDHLSTAALARDVVDLASASPYTLGSTLWLHQTVLRERLRGRPRAPPGPTAWTKVDAGWSQPDVERDRGAVSVTRWCARWCCSCGCALDDALPPTSSSRKGDIPRGRDGTCSTSSTAQPARISFERASSPRRRRRRRFRRRRRRATRSTRSRRLYTFNTRDEADMWPLANARPNAVDGPAPRSPSD